jgi:hypothetical protein
MMRVAVVLLVVCVCVAAAGGGGYYLYSQQEAVPPSDGSAPAKDAGEMGAGGGSSVVADAAPVSGGTGTVQATVMPRKKYVQQDHHDLPGWDIQCFQDGSDVGRCQALCDADATCTGYVGVGSGGAWGAASGCCTKNVPTGHGLAPAPTAAANKVTYWGVQ